LLFGPGYPERPIRVICATAHGFTYQGLASGGPAGQGWRSVGRLRRGIAQPPGVRLAFGYIPDQSGGVVIVCHEVDGNEERVPRWARSTYVSTARWLTIRVTSAANNGPSPTTTADAQPLASGGYAASAWTWWAAVERVDLDIARS
jgi:hypothetical protein